MSRVTTEISEFFHPICMNSEELTLVETRKSDGIEYITKGSIMFNGLEYFFNVDNYKTVIETETGGMLITNKNEYSFEGLDIEETYDDYDIVVV